jgi:hypothetical protein
LDADPVKYAQLMTDLHMGDLSGIDATEPIWAKLPFLDRGIPAGAQHIAETKDINKMSQKDFVMKEIS